MGISPHFGLGLKKLSRMHSGFFDPSPYKIRVGAGWSIWPVHYQYFHLIFVKKHCIFLKKLSTNLKFINKNERV